MSRIEVLPQETLRAIISYLDEDYAALTNCSLTCRALWNVATASLYRDINLTYREDYNHTTSSTTKQKSYNLLESLAYNPELAAHVRSFENHQDSNRLDVVSAESADGSHEFLSIAAAKNMTQLSKALFVPNPFAIHIITNIQSYPLLEDLTIHDIEPKRFIWTRTLTSLRKLTWRFEADHRIDQWSAIQFLIHVVECTCPELETLTINRIPHRDSISNHQHYVRINLPDLALAAPEQSEEIPSNADIGLNHFRNFSYRFSYTSAPNSAAKMQDGFVAFVTKYRHQLTSICITIPESSSPTDETSHAYVLQVCNLLTNLKALEIITLGKSWESDINDGTQFLTALSDNPIIRNIERLSIADVFLPFSPSLGQFFSTWPNLKVLRLGDADNSQSPFNSDGRLQFDDYAPHILDFIKALPPTIEELYIEINGEDLSCDDDEDFNPVANLGAEIFTSLPRLHTCDIHAWISNTGDAPGQIPDKGVFYRRLPPSREVLGNTKKVKEVWTSRLDCIYQSEDVNVRKACQEVEEPEVGWWKGEDAKEVWCDGYEFQRVWDWSMRGRELESARTQWPFFRDVVGAYRGFREK